MSDWTDSDGNSLGEWAEIDLDEYHRLYVSASDELTPFETLTDPDGTDGKAQVYTAWGRRGEDTPYIDVRDYRDENGSTEGTLGRQFVPARTQPEPESTEVTNA